MDSTLRSSCWPLLCVGGACATCPFAPCSTATMRKAPSRFPTVAQENDGFSRPSFLAQASSSGDLVLRGCVGRVSSCAALRGPCSQTGPETSAHLLTQTQKRRKNQKLTQSDQRRTTAS